MTRHGSGVIASGYVYKYNMLSPTSILDIQHSTSLHRYHQSHRIPKSSKRSKSCLETIIPVILLTVPRFVCIDSSNQCYVLTILQEEVQDAASKGGQSSAGGFASMDPDKQVRATVPFET